MEGIFGKMTPTHRLAGYCEDLNIYDEGNWNEPYKTERGYHSFNDGGVECEVGEFLYGLVRLLKPQNILETGTHLGIGAMYMGMACMDNEEGTVYTVEFLKEFHDEARRRFDRIDGIGERIVSVFGDASKQKFDQQFDLIFLDTEPQTRFSELIYYFKNLKEGGFVFIHDLHRHMHQIPNEEHGFAWPYGVIPSEIEKMVLDGVLRPWHFPSPRGFTGFYKVSEKDYKWKKTS